MQIFIRGSGRQKALNSHTQNPIRIQGEMSTPQPVTVWKYIPPVFSIVVNPSVFKAA
jgi:hypothetical protein